MSISDNLKTILRQAWLAFENRHQARFILITKALFCSVCVQEKVLSFKINNINIASGKAERIRSGHFSGRLPLDAKEPIAIEIKGDLNGRLQLRDGRCWLSDP